MKEKIYANMCFVALLAIVLTTAVATLVYYGNLERQIQRELMAEARYLAAGVEVSGMEYLERLSGEESGERDGSSARDRVTLIGADGMVLYDNYAASGTMENHADRQEVRQAMELGAGSDSRVSDTLSEKTFYYALLLSDGTVIRVAASTASVWANIAGMIPALCLAVIGICCLSVMLAVRQTGNIVRPINEIDLNHPAEAKAYDELAPLLGRIRRQQDTIRRQMEELIARQKEFTAITENMSEGFIVVGRNGEAVSYNTSALRLLGVDPEMTGKETDTLGTRDEIVRGENGRGEENARGEEVGGLNILRFNRSRIFQDAAGEALAGRHNERNMELAGRIYQIIANPVQGRGESSAAGVQVRGGSGADGVQVRGGSSADGGQTRGGSGADGAGTRGAAGVSSAQATGEVTGAVLVILDVTEKQNREALRREFTANVSHELKTPLTSISGYAEIMKNGLVKPDDMRRFSENIYKEAQRMIALVGDILKLSQLDEGRVGEEKEPVDLYELSGDIVRRLKAQAAAAGVSLSLTGSPQTVQGSRQILDEMIFNLCDNGIKYNRPGGHVAIHVSSDGGRLRICVEDDGIGIPAADRSRVFERFYRVDKSRSRQIGGTGLGLSIVKHGAIFHGAEVRMESEEGTGTKVEILF